MKTSRVLKFSSSCVSISLVLANPALLPNIQYPRGKASIPSAAIARERSGSDNATGETVG